MGPTYGIAKIRSGSAIAKTKAGIIPIPTSSKMDAKNIIKSNTPNLSCIFRGKSLYIFFSESIIRSEEHTSELQSRGHLVCRLLLEKKKKKTLQHHKKI